LRKKLVFEWVKETPNLQSGNYALRPAFDTWLPGK